MKKRSYIAAFVLLVLCAAAPGMVYASTATTSVRIPVLVYHSVFPDHGGQTSEQRAYSVTPEILEEQLKYLDENGYVTLLMESAANVIREGLVPERLVVLTFDDGWWNQHHYALPLLEKWHATATFFIYPHAIQNGSLFMDWNQIRELASAGMEIGSHSYDHPYFSALTHMQLEAQMQKSKKAIEAEIERPVYAFATPYGYTSSEIEGLLKEKGYTVARTLGGKAHAGPEDLYHLKGFVAPRDMTRFEWILEDAP